MHFRHRQTDRQTAYTDWHHGISARGRLYITSRAKNWFMIIIVKDIQAKAVSFSVYSMSEGSTQFLGVHVSGSAKIS